MESKAYPPPLGSSHQDKQSDPPLAQLHPFTLAKVSGLDCQTFCEDESRSVAEPIVPARISNPQSILDQTTPPPQKRRYHGPWADPVEVAVGRTRTTTPLPPVIPDHLLHVRRGGFLADDGLQCNWPNHEAFQILERMNRAEVPLSLKDVEDNRQSKVHLLDHAIPASQTLPRMLSRPRDVISNSSSQSPKVSKTETEAHILYRQQVLSDQEESQSALDDHLEWTLEEDYLLIKLKGLGMAWEDISRNLPGRDFLSCRLRYLSLSSRWTSTSIQKRCKINRELARAAPAPVGCGHSDCIHVPLFRTQRLLDSHQKIHHQGILHCPMENCRCSMSNISSYGLKTTEDATRHQVEHGSPGYVCPFCPEQYCSYPFLLEFLRHIAICPVGESELLGIGEVVYLGMLAALELETNGRELVSNRIDTGWIVQCPVYNCLSFTKKRKRSSTYGHHQKCRKCVRRSPVGAVLPNCHQCGRLMEHQKLDGPLPLSGSSGDSVTRSVGSSVSSQGV